ncbi:hypothetical protein BOX15_Mlig002228g1 [Macrostomum lignano]|uniref:Uncharacterized protein n=1 Tax=Macrostomum lignano TaxID=282301 RepID=A0A267FS34_9PLAT|nr:hypothetical protein BOX15_Mlig002228g1 [Macrostomum lignano]
MPSASVLQLQHRCCRLVIQRYLRLVEQHRLRLGQPGYRRCSSGGGGSDLGRIARRLRDQPRQQQQQQQQKQQDPNSQSGAWSEYSTQTAEFASIGSTQTSKAVLLFEAPPHQLYKRNCLSGLIALLSAYLMFDHLRHSRLIAGHEEAALQRRLMSDDDLLQSGDGDSVDDAADTSWLTSLASSLPSSSLGSPINLLIAALLSLTALLSGMYAFAHPLRLARRLVLEPGGHLLVTSLTGARRIPINQMRAAAPANLRWIDMAPLYTDHLLIAAPPAEPNQKRPRLLAVDKDSRFVKEPTLMAALVKQVRMQAVR